MKFARDLEFSEFASNDGILVVILYSLHRLTKMVDNVLKQFLLVH